MKPRSRASIVERLSVPGFLFGRRHKALSGSPGYFNFYMVETPEVLTSKPYLERLDHPTPLTRTIMSEVFVNMNRTVCRRTIRRGSSRGAFAVVARFNQQPDEAALSAVLEKLAAEKSVASGEIWPKEFGHVDGSQPDLSPVLLGPLDGDAQVSSLDGPLMRKA